MRIQHNIAALNTHRALNFSNNQLGKTLEKLSSGYRINRAGDDAAGLAISEKMRGQIRGLDMAQKNTQDAISLVQTAEGALNEVHAMLQRGRELSVQAANDTNTQFDREQLQEEINQLNEEIDHLANRTEFNTKKLLKGNAILSIDASSATGGSTATKEEEIKTLTERLLNSMLGQSEKMVKEAFGLTPNEKFKVDVKYEDDAVGGRVAWVMVGGQTSTNLTTGVTTVKSYPTELVLDKKDFFGDQDLWISADRIIAHEMVHAVMGGAINSFHDLPGWFVEGTAEYVAGANERVQSSFQNMAYKDYGKNFYGTNASITTTQAQKDAIYQKLAGKLGEQEPPTTPTTPNVLVEVNRGQSHNANYTSDAYSAGYLASKFLDAKIKEADASKSIQDFMLDLQSGTTFDAALNKYTFYANNNDFESAFKTDTSATGGAAFIKNLVESTTTDFRTSTGSILAGRLGYPDTDLGIVPDEDLTSSFFNYNWDKSTLYSPSMLLTQGGGTDADIESDSGNLTFQIGANEGQSLTLDLPNVSSMNLGTKFVKVLSHESATKAITTFDKAINAISSVRSNLGAVQNRLEHTINNLGAASENLTNAESRIRDTDMAKEMMQFTKQNILMQAAQSMLSQANQQPQGILQLLG